MALDPNRTAGDRNRKTLMVLGGIIAVAALLIVLGGVVMQDAGDRAGSALNAQAPAAGDPGTLAAEDAVGAGADADGIADDTDIADADMMTDDGMTAANTSSNPTVGDTASTGIQTATAGAGTCDFAHLVGGTASEAANAIRQANRPFYMVTPDVDVTTIADTIRNQQVRIDVDGSGRVTGVSCPSGT